MEKDILNEVEQAFSAPTTNDAGGFVVDLGATYKEPQFLLEIDGVGTMPRGDLQAVKAKAKSGKTLALSVMASALLSGRCMELRAREESLKVLFCDTEQSIASSAKVARRVHRLCGFDVSKNHERFRVLNLRPLTPQERWSFIIQQVDEFKPDVIFIDGTRDLVADFNDLAESSVCINKLMELSAEKNCAIVNVLHQNKNSSMDGGAMRGHLGTELLNKCSDVWEVKRTDRIFKVSETDCRNEPTPDWSFTLDEDATPIPLETEQPQSKDEVRIAEMVECIKKTLADGGRYYNDLKRIYAEISGTSERTASRHIKLMVLHETIRRCEADDKYYLN